MTTVPKEVILTKFNNYNENIELSTNYNNIKKSEVRKSSQIVNWSEQLVVLALSHLNPFNNEKQEKKVFRQQRSYEKMKLSINRQNGVLSKSISADSIMIRKNCSYDTISNASQSDTASEISTSSSLSSESSFNSSSSISSHGYGSLFDITEPKKCDNAKVIQRFGNGFRDKCLFPLALTLNVCDLSKGKFTWDVLLMKADLALNKWQECQANSRKVNRVFGSPSDFVCPDSSLQNKFLFRPRAHKSLKRWNSFEDLQQLSHEHKQSIEMSTKTNVTTDDMFLTRNEFKRPEMDWNDKSEPNLMIRKSSNASEDSYKICFKSNSSPSLINKAEYNAKALIRSMKIVNPLSLALQITKIDKQCFLQLNYAQIFGCMTGERKINQNNDMTELNVLLEFGQELNQLVISIIRKEITPETQGKKIAGFIEVACALRRLRNWHSLCIVMRALQSPKIYFMEEGWMSMKRTYPIHYNDYLKLCRLVRACETCIMGTTRPIIPSINSLVSSLSIHCIATWDLLENKRRWTEQPSIAGWLDNELIGQLVESQKMREKQEESDFLSLDGSQCSLLPANDSIRFIHYSSLPNNWAQKDIKCIPDSYLKQITECLKSSFKNEINSIRHYNIPSYQS